MGISHCRVSPISLDGQISGEAVFLCQRSVAQDDMTQWRVIYAIVSILYFTNNFVTCSSSNDDDAPLQLVENNAAEWFGNVFNEWLVKNISNYNQTTAEAATGV